jgi:hypothetical protein
LPGHRAQTAEFGDAAPSPTPVERTGRRNGQTTPKRTLPWLTKLSQDAGMNPSARLYRVSAEGGEPSPVMGSKSALLHALQLRADGYQNILLIDAETFEESTIAQFMQERGYVDTGENKLTYRKV